MLVERREHNDAMHSAIAAGAGAQSDMSQTLFAFIYNTRTQANPPSVLSCQTVQ